MIKLYTAKRIPKWESKNTKCKGKLSDHKTQKLKVKTHKCLVGGIRLKIEKVGVWERGPYDFMLILKCCIIISGSLASFVISACKPTNVVDKLWLRRLKRV